ncbi:MAG: phosphoribosylaminoimidazolesuccinocarboxamide synthase [Chloroherpetonaceae bacterium]|nr:phosphoribosylaminoimidazolesuccinocarboxamide synthase [Chthonomonadaceae bacterium]MDW8206656.1 phosphoribosylaminoimidazolesuccinocarboxamide synthase [Chloroherpetonaceae bacterium]
MALPLLRSEIPGLARFATGKVRDVYDLGDTLLLVATDRISAFDVIMPNGIPDKGRVLTQMSRFWFRRLRPMVCTHYITTDMDYIMQCIMEAGGTMTPELCAALEGRSMLCVRAQPFPIECVVRGYLAGSLWREYREAGGENRPVVLHGVHLPAGLRESEQLPAPIFTPATKATDGHDVNISEEQAAALIGSETVRFLAEVSIALYQAAAAHARRCGILLADTKFEFGLHGGAITLIDEALTPDSSRFWEAATYAPGRNQPSYDKQFVRDWLEASGWNKEPPAPELPGDVVARTADKYREAYQRLTGQPLR